MDESGDSGGYGRAEDGDHEAHVAACLQPEFTDETPVQGGRRCRLSHGGNARHGVHGRAPSGKPMARRWRAIALGPWGRDHCVSLVLMPSNVVLTLLPRL